MSSYEVSRAEDIVSIEDEVVAANSVLDQIEKCLPKSCKKIMIAGNHEARYEKFFVNKANDPDIRRIREFSNWHAEYELDRRGWEHYEYGKYVQIGKIVFTHGWFCSGNAAKKMAECFPGKNVLFGHTHRHLVHGCLDERGFPIESESIGTLSRFDLSYLKGKPPIDWIHSFLYIDVEPSGFFTKHFVRVINGGFVEYGKKFSC